MGEQTTTAVRRLAASRRLAERRLEILPLTGTGAAFARVQPRSPTSDAMAPAELAELISSIATVGVLQPILVEELDDGGRRLVAGERRLRACKWLAVHHPDRQRFGEIPAVVCPGPLSEEDRRIWQVVENLAREDLAPGELAAALLFERCAVLARRLQQAGVEVSGHLLDIEDPVQRFRQLDRLRLDHNQHGLGAPWPQVLRRLGIQVSERKARHLVKAFAALPAEVSSQMDAAGVALTTRLRLLDLDRGRDQAAAQLWAAVKERGRPELLSRAVDSKQARPDLSEEEAVEAAAAQHAAANQARAAAARRDSTAGADSAPARRVDPEVAEEALRALRALVGQLEEGRRPARYTAGSLHLHAERLLALVAATSKGREAA